MSTQPHIDEHQVANILHTARIKRRLTQKEMGDQFHVASNFISRAERGLVNFRRVKSRVQLETLAKKLRFDIPYRTSSTNGNGVAQVEDGSNDVREAGDANGHSEPARAPRPAFVRPEAINGKACEVDDPEAHELAVVFKIFRLLTDIPRQRRHYIVGYVNSVFGEAA